MAPWAILSAPSSSPAFRIPSDFSSKSPAANKKNPDAALIFPQSSGFQSPIADPLSGAEPAHPSKGISRVINMVKFFLTLLIFSLP